jgi:putative ABC transport system permease protein
MTREEVKIILTLFFSAAFLRKKRAILTIAAIAWGTVAILLLLAFGQGLQDRLLMARKGMGENIAVVWPGQTSEAYKGLKEGKQIIFRVDDIDFLRERLPEFEGIVGEMTNWGTTLTYGRKTVTAWITGANWQYGDLRNQIPQKGGRFIDPQDEKERKRVIFIGNERAKELFGTEDPVGKEVLLNGSPYTVIGVLKKKIQMGNYKGPDDNNCVIPLSTFVSQYGRQELDNIVLKVSKPETMVGGLKRLKETLGGKCGFNPDDSKAVFVWDTVDSSKYMVNFTLGLNIFLGIIGVLTLLVGGTGIANIMYAVVKEKTKEIGILMAIGARSRWITLPFMLQSLFYTLLGGAFGLLISGTIIFVISLIPTEGNEAIEFLGKPTLSIPIGIFTALVLGTIGLLAGHFPAKRASQIEPAETLRYE